MKKKKSTTLLTLVILSLLAIGAVSIISYIKNQPKNEKSDVNQSSILGESTISEITPPQIPDFNNIIQSSIQNTKETVSQKVIEIQDDITKYIEKEFAHLTQSQIDSLKTQMCRDWGIINPVPTLNH